MNYNTEYLLRYISNDTYKRICDKKSDYILKLVSENYIDTDLNIKYLIKYGIKDIDKVVYEMLEELTIRHNDFISKIKEYEKNHTKEEIIMILENV